MSLLRDEYSCREAVKAFVARRLGAGDFARHLSRHWHHHGIAESTVSGLPPHCDVLDSIHGLCQTYASSMTDDHCYQVSEEQFRTEVNDLASTSWLTRPAAI